MTATTTPDPEANPRPSGRIARLWHERRRTLVVAAAAVVVVAGLLMGRSGGEDSVRHIAGFEVQRGNLVIDVTQGGDIQALQALEVRSEIEVSQGTKILSIVEEGYEITAEDVAEGKVLVELDSTDLREEITRHEIDFQNALAALLEAAENISIQASENQSAIKDVRQVVRFALLDFEKFMGTDVARGILEERGLPHDAATLEQYELAMDADLERQVIAAQATVAGNGNGASTELASGASGDELAMVSPADLHLGPDIPDVSQINFLHYIENDALDDGEAQQRLRQLQDDALLYQSEVALAEENMEGSRRLAERQFITRSALEGEMMSLEKSRLALQTAQTALDIYRRYEFPKLAEETLSNYNEALQRMRRVKREARSRMAKVEAVHRSAEHRYRIAEQKMEHLEYQLERCIIRAERPGLVAYGSPSDNRSRRSTSEPIGEGATVRLRQTIITIPDMSRMSVAVGIHESQVKRVSIGQRARIVADAEPDRTLEGKVAELAVLPDSSNFRHNPNMKVYPARVHIEGMHDFLKPGMNARVEIIVNELTDVLFVPVQAVNVRDGVYYGFVRNGNRAERRRLEVGEFNDQFIQIRSGLEEGEELLLSPPPGFGDDTDEHGPAVADTPDHLLQEVSASDA